MGADRHAEKAASSHDTRGVLHPASDHSGSPGGILQCLADVGMEINDDILRRRSPLPHCYFPHADGLLHIRLHVSSSRCLRVAERNHVFLEAFG